MARKTIRIGNHGQGHKSQGGMLTPAQRATNATSGGPALPKIHGSGHRSTTHQPARKKKG